jgi:hypothetical protein
MHADERAIGYIDCAASEYGVTTMTPRQRRRWKHKLHRTGEPWPAEGKGRPTPRQRKQASDG